MSTSGTAEQPKRWQCYLCNYRNNPQYDNCIMCDKPKPFSPNGSNDGNKRKLEEINICPESSSPFHVCTERCSQRWGIEIEAKENADHQPPYKKHKSNDDEFEWSCSLCTVLNSPSAIFCYVCGTQRDAASISIEIQKRRQRDAFDAALHDNDSFDVLSDTEPDAVRRNHNHLQIEKNNHNMYKHTQHQHNATMDNEEQKQTESNVLNVSSSSSSSKAEADDSDHESDDDVVVNMIESGLTPQRVQQSVKRNQKQKQQEEKRLHNVSNTNSNKNAKQQNQTDSLFELSLNDYLQQHFECVDSKHDAEERYIADIVAETALPEDEYWDAHNMANTIPFVDKGDELDAMIHGFDHGSIASKVIYGSKGKAKTKYVGGRLGNGGDDEIDENSVRRVNIQREFSYAMRTNQIVKCRLIRRRIFDDQDDGDTHFRICESQFMRSCHNLGATNANGMCSTLKEVVYVINPELIRKFQAKKEAMKSRLGAGGVNTILAWHGTPSNNVDSIVENNFSLSHLSKNSGDTGWYGAGIYFSEFANVSQGYGDGLLLCKIMLGKTHKMNTIKVGCERKQGYDSHMAGGGKYGTEIVIFDMDQILPCYVCKY